MQTGAGALPGIEPTAAMSAVSTAFSSSQGLSECRRCSGGISPTVRDGIRSAALCPSRNSCFSSRV